MQRLDALNFSGAQCFLDQELWVNWNQSGLPSWAAEQTAGCRPSSAELSAQLAVG